MRHSLYSIKLNVANARGRGLMVVGLAVGENAAKALVYEMGLDDKVPDTRFVKLLDLPVTPSPFPDALFLIVEFPESA